MPHLAIKINRVGDPPTPLFPDGEPCEEAILHAACVLERGMASGEPSITFGITTRDGKHYIAQTSAALMETLRNVIEGARANWRENPRP